MRKLAILVLAALALVAACSKSSTGPAANTGTLTVVVTTTTGAAVAAAPVVLQPGSRTVSTDAQGTARFTNLTAGQYTLTVQAAQGSAQQSVSFQPPSSEIHLTLGGLFIEEASVTMQWGAPESLRVTIASGQSGEIVWVSTRDFYRGVPAELGRGPAVSLAPLRPGTTTVEARLVSGGSILATAIAQVTVTYRESWNVDRLGLVPYPTLSVGDLIVSGRHAYVARRGFRGFSVVDVDAVAEIGRFDPGGGFAQDVHVVGNRAYVTHESGALGFRHGVTIVDITNPAAPVELGGIPFELSGAHTVFVDGTTAYLANSSARVIVIWDVANPAAPVRLATVASMGGIAHEAYVKDDVLYGAYMQLTPSTIPELTVVNVANPAAPIVLARVTYPNAALVHSATATPNGDYLYVADEVTNAPIRIFNVTNPAAPVLVGTYQPRFGTVPHHFVVRDNGIAYLSNYKNGVEVVDISDPTRPRLVGFYDTHPGQATDGSTAIPSDNVDLYRGAWGVHWTDDGKIVVSDMDAGVFVLRFGG